jgi:hypothetical protein
MRNAARSLVSRIPVLKRLLDERHAIVSRFHRFGTELPFVPDGHYYSPIPDLDEVRRDDRRLFQASPVTIPSLDLAEEAQLLLLQKFAEYYKDLGFPVERQSGSRYYYENPAYSYSDAITLYCMLRHVRPARLIEIGSGYSSCATLDTNEQWLGGSLACTFIEPYPELLRSLLQPRDLSSIEIIPKRLQDVDLDIFAQLQGNDVLFVDSTHVSKIGSDVNRIVFDILPTLASGVYIHFHDIFYPFEYPRHWVYEGRAWNELYILRAFLQYNQSFRVVCFNTFLAEFHRDFFSEHMPLCLKNPGGSLWLQKL